MCLKRYQSLIGPPAVVPVADWLSLPNLPYSHLLLSTKSRSVYSINGLRLVEGMCKIGLAKKCFGCINIHQGQVGGPQVPLLDHGDEIETQNWACRAIGQYVGSRGFMTHDS